MSSSIRIEIISRETIKPSSPTPIHLKNFKLSLFDQISFPEYGPMLLFYNGDGCDHHHHHYRGFDGQDQVDDGKVSQISHRLRKSLSETLTLFYPLAGELKDNAIVDCNDNGAEYIEAYANFNLRDIVLKQPDYGFLLEFLPTEVESPKATTCPLLLVKATFFICGGVAIGTCFSHKFGDGRTHTTFLNNWASISRRSDKPVAPQYLVASILPPIDDCPMPLVYEIQDSCITKRFVFVASKATELKNKVASASVTHPSRVEAVTALIWKCATTSSRSIRGYPRLSMLVHAMDLRDHTTPPLTGDSAGNIVGYFHAYTTSDSEIELQDLVCRLREQREEFKKNGIQTITKNKSLFDIPKELGSRVEKGDGIDFYMFSSVSGFPLYESDFGWGKPIWVTIPGYNSKNVVMLMATNDGKGIEALVSLNKQEMALFEHDPELLAFAALNPSVSQELYNRKIKRVDPKSRL